VGNKWDLAGTPDPDIDGMVNQLRYELKCEYFKVSCKSGTNVNDSFKVLVE